MHTTTKLCWLVVLIAHAFIVRVVGDHTSHSHVDAIGRESDVVFDPEPINHQIHVEGIFTPGGRMASLSEEHFSQLQHPMFSQHRVRIKKTRFCDETVNSYTGYIDIGARHLFFYFFESRTNPEKDDVIYWTNGGMHSVFSANGCAINELLILSIRSRMHFFFGTFHGTRITDSKGPKYHLESWNSNANLLAVEQPIGVGFSYADYGETVETSEEAGKDIAAFLAIFFEHFTQFKGRALHLAGESHGGIYIPAFAAEIYDQNTRLIEHGLTPINLTSIMLGNGMTDVYTMMPAYYDMTCTLAGGRSPVLDISTCVRMKQAVPRCKKWMKESCVDKFDKINCAAALSFCETELSEPLNKTGLNPYDMTQMCAESDEIPCYPVASHITTYLNLPSTRTLLGVSQSFKNFTLVAWEINAAFGARLDMMRSRVPLVSALLERGVKVLVYVGTNDFSCNWLGNEQWTLEMEWSGQRTFAQQDLREWTVRKNVTGQGAGMVRSANGLTFATIEGAGHMVPYDKPHEALELISRWLSGDDF